MAALLPHQVTSSAEFLRSSPVELHTRDFEQESRKLISQELHCTKLAEYYRTRRIPHELRSHIRPSQLKEDEAYCKQFQAILDKCSFELMLLTIDFLQKSIKETREKISTIEQQLTSCLPEMEWTSLKAKMEKVFTEFRKETEIKEREKFLQDAEYYQLKQVYRWQDPPLTNTRNFLQDQTDSSGSESGTNRKNPFYLRQLETSPTKRAGIHHRRRLNTHPDSLSDLNNLEQVSSISESYKKNRGGCTGRPSEVALENSKRGNRLVVQKSPKNSEAAADLLPVSKPESPLHDKKVITESDPCDDNLTTVQTLQQTVPDKGLSPPDYNPTSDEAIERLKQQSSHCKTHAKCLSRPVKVSTGTTAESEPCWENIHSTRAPKKPVVTYPGRRPCTCVLASDEAHGTNFLSNKSSKSTCRPKCRSSDEPDSKMCSSHPSSVDKGSRILPLHGKNREQAATDQPPSRRKKCKRSLALRSKCANNCKIKQKYLERKGKILFQKVSWKPQECNRCSKKFSVVVIKTGPRHREEVVKWRVRSCVTGQGKTCTECKKRIQARRASSRKKTYSCTECGKCFMQHALLDLHQKSHIEEKLFVCHLCGKRFVQHALLLLHQKAHTVNKPYQCTECGNLFFSKSLFTEHLRTHKERKPCCCSDCGKCFADNTTLLIHRRIHTGEKPFSCKECNKTFSQHSTLVSHQRIHSGEKPYECRVCGKRFSDRSSYAGHQRIHNGEKPFKCQECGKRFTQSSNLRRHERLHMEQKMYVCATCGKDFNESSKLKSHENVHLKIERRRSQRTK